MTNPLIFLAIVVVIYFSLHAVIYGGLKRTLVRRRRNQIILQATFWFLGGSFFLQILASRLWHFHFLRFPAYTWMGLIVTTSFLFMVHRLLIKLWPARSRDLALAALIVSVLIGGYSLWNGLRPPMIRRIEVPLKNLPPGLAGFKIVQLSDLHLEDPFSSKRLAGIVSQVNELRPGLVVITGDLIDGPIQPNGAISAEFKRLKASCGVLAVSGNHDYYAGINHFWNLTRNSGIHVLNDEMITLENGLQLAGQDDATVRHFNGETPAPLARILARRKPEEPLILLCHRPTSFDESISQGIDFQLSGHTHGGQFFPINFLVRLLFKYPYGFYHCGNSFLYTSCGTGLWGPDMRFLTHNEIVEFTLIPGPP
jgi:predicted MPP superfamily phosphohydrolase